MELEWWHWCLIVGYGPVIWVSLNISLGAALYYLVNGKHFGG